MDKVRKLMVVPFDAKQRSSKLDATLIRSIWKICFKLINFGYFNEDGNFFRGNKSVKNVLEIFDLLFNMQGLKGDPEVILQILSSAQIDPQSIPNRDLASALADYADSTAVSNPQMKSKDVRKLEKFDEHFGAVAPVVHSEDEPRYVALSKTITENRASENVESARPNKDSFKRIPIQTRSRGVEKSRVKKPSTR